MKSILIIIVGSLLLSPCTAKDKDGLYADFARSSRKPVILDDTFYNPFKVNNRAEIMTVDRPNMALTNEEILRLIAAKKVQGEIFGQDDVGLKVIIGDAVFSPGDEIAFYDADGYLVPLSLAGTVRVGKITHDALGLEISIMGQPSRNMEYPLRSFSNFQ